MPEVLLLRCPRSGGGYAGTRPGLAPLPRGVRHRAAGAARGCAAGGIGGSGVFGGHGLRQARGVSGLGLGPFRYTG